MKLNVLLTKSIFLLFIFSCVFCLPSLKAQNTSFSISGKVTDDNGKGMPSVTVSIKGSKTSTFTDSDGSYTITAPSSKSVLLFTYVGYDVKEIAVNDKSSTLNISLSISQKQLEDVVVIGYGTKKKSDVTGAVASISGEKLRSVPATNLTNALQGRIPGVEVAATSFRPGSGSRIRIRGNRSLSASNEPLYVVDGIPVSYTIDDMNPTDVESIDVLKDAASTAIYGVRGANGVVQITTKKGKNGKVSISYEGSTSFDNIIKQIPVFNAVQLADCWRNAYYADKQYNFAQNTTQPNNYFPSAAADAKLFGGSTGNPMWDFIKDAYQFTTFDRATNTYIAVKRPTTADERTLLANLGLPVLTEVDAYDPSKVKGFDWQSAFLRQGITNSHNINVSIGTEKLRSSLGLSYFKQRGIEFGQDYTRYTVSNNSEFKVAKFLTMGNSFSYTNGLQNVGPSQYGSANGQLPFTKPTDSTGKFMLYPNLDQQIISGANDLGRVINENKINRVFGNAYVELALFKGLKYKTVFGIDYRNVRNGRFNGTNTSVRQTGVANASYQIANSTSWTYDNLLYYDTKIKKNHAVNITMLYELQSLDKSDVLNLSADNLIFEEQKWYSLQNNTAGLVTGSGTYRASQYQSYMGRLEYAYKNRYFLTASNRYDESSVLAESKKGEYFPSASVAWRIDNEKFFRKQHIFNAAKIRVGIGRVGNAAIDPYQTNGPLGFTLYNWGNGAAAIGSAPTTFRVPNLTWEKTTTKDIGFEFSLLKNRITTSIDVYKSTTTDALQRMNIPATNGVTFMYVNLGKIENKGIDVSLSTVNLDTKSGFRWATDFVFSKNKEAIVELDATGNDNLNNLWFRGQPISVYYNYQSEGIFQYADTMPGGILKDYFWTIPANKASGLFAPGKIRVKDLNGDKLINASDKQVLGFNNATWTGSITNTFSYKNFEVNVNIYFRKGGMYRVPRPGMVGRFQSTYANYWTPTNPSNEYQQPTRTSDIPTYWEALGYRDGSYARVRNISVSFKLPQAVLTKLKATNMTFYVNAINPFLFHKHSDFDPETIQYTEQFAASTGNPGPNSYSYKSMVVGIKLGL
jgi:TonB-dependent starch-binding outer membrane protein SusC